MLKLTPHGDRLGELGLRIAALPYRVDAMFCSQHLAAIRIADYLNLSVASWKDEYSGETRHVTVREKSHSPGIPLEGRVAV